MSPHFERDSRYPWAVVLYGTRYVPTNHQTGERLNDLASPSIKVADQSLDRYREHTRAGKTPREAVELVREQNQREVMVALYGSTRDPLAA